MDLEVSPLSSVAVSLYLPEMTPTSTFHWQGVQTAYISGPGNFAGESDFDPAETITSRIFLTEIMVDAPPDARAVVTFGDSITGPKGENWRTLGGLGFCVEDRGR